MSCLRGDKQVLRLRAALRPCAQDDMTTTVVLSEAKDLLVEPAAATSRSFDFGPRCGPSLRTTEGLTVTVAVPVPLANRNESPQNRSAAHRRCRRRVRGAAPRSPCARRLPPAAAVRRESEPFAVLVREGDGAPHHLAGSCPRVNSSTASAIPTPLASSRAWRRGRPKHRSHGCSTWPCENVRPADGARQQGNTSLQSQRLFNWMSHTVSLRL